MQPEIVAELEAPAARDAVEARHASVSDAEMVEFVEKRTETVDAPALAAPLLRAV